MVRHGLVHNPRRVAYGFLPRMGLAPEGREQARRAGCELRHRDPAALYTSPLLRAVQTGRLIHEAMPQAPVHRSWLLRESELARLWQGTLVSERPQRFPEEWRLFSETPSRSTAGETLAAQAERLRRVIDRALRRYPHGGIVIVSHRDPIVALRLTVQGRPLDELHTTPCEPGSITELAACDGVLTFAGYTEP